MSSLELDHHSICLKVTCVSLSTFIPFCQQIFSFFYSNPTSVFFSCQSFWFSSAEYAFRKEQDICFTKSHDAFFMTLLPLFMQTRGGGERTTYRLDVQTLDGTNGFYEDHSGEDQ